MARSRLSLQKKLEDLMHDVWEELSEDEKSKIPDYKDNVYFQAPSSNKMRYPAIVYERHSADTSFADNNPYMYQHRYQITVIDRNPDSSIPDRVAALPETVHDRNFVTDNLHHDCFMTYF